MVQNLGLKQIKLQLVTIKRTNNNKKLYTHTEKTKPIKLKLGLGVFYTSGQEMDPAHSMASRAAWSPLRMTRLRQNFVIMFVKKSDDV